MAKGWKGAFLGDGYDGFAFSILGCFLGRYWRERDGFYNFREGFQDGVLGFLQGVYGVGDEGY